MTEQITEESLKQALDVLTTLKLELEAKGRELAEREKILEEKRNELFKRREAIQEEEKNLQKRANFQSYLTTALDRRLTTAFLNQFHAVFDDITLTEIGIMNDDQTMSLIQIHIDKEGDIKLHNQKKHHSYQPFAYNASYLYPALELLHNLNIIDQCKLYFPLNMRPLVITIKNSNLAILLAPITPDDEH